MKQLSNNAILCGLAFGLIALAMSASPLAGAMVLFLFVPLPILVAVLGFSTQAGIVAAVTCVIGTFSVLSPESGLIVGFVIILPALAVGYLANLARSAEEYGRPHGELIWFPLADIMFYLCLLVAAGFILLDLTIFDYGPEASAQFAKQMIAVIKESDSTLVLPDGMESSLANFIQKVLPALQPATWVIVLSANFYVASRITQRLKLNKRPVDFWPLALRLPRPALYCFCPALAIAFFIDPLASFGAAFAGSLGMGFIMAGLAMVHGFTLGKPGRMILLVMIYVTLILLSLALFVFLVIGLFDTRRQVGITRNNET